jgi:transposase InsO family protein
VRTTVSDKATPCPPSHVYRRLRAPRAKVLSVSDFTYVATWTGFVYVAFVIDAYARRIVGWRVSRSAHAGFVLTSGSSRSINSRNNRAGRLSRSNPDGDLGHAIRDRDGIRQTDYVDASHDGRVRTSRDCRAPERCRC